MLLAKLYFRYGAVGSAKTLNLLAVAHNYERQGKRVVVFKPQFDTRFGVREVASRAGLGRVADQVLGEQVEFDPAQFSDVACVLVDEAQFLAPAVVESLRDLTRTARAPVICYGLRTDFRTRLFAGSRRLLELADSIEEIKTTCAYCNSKAIFNLKIQNGSASTDGPSQELGAEELYQACCYRHYMDHLKLDALDQLESRREERPHAHH